MVREGGDKDPKIRAEAANEVPLPMHIDGFTYGHDCPDAMFLLCDRDSAEGGESVLVDDHLVLDALRAEPPGSAGAQLLAFMTGTVLDLTSPGHGATVGHDADGPRPRAVASSGWAPCATASVRWPTIPTRPAPRPGSTRSTTLFESAARSGRPRFRLAPGEAVCVDNYRVSHSRDGYVDLDRLFWRVWAWTDDVVGVPEGRLASDVRYAGS